MAGKVLDSHGDKQISGEEFDGFVNTCVDEGKIGLGMKAFESIAHIAAGDIEQAKSVIMDTVTIEDWDTVTFEGVAMGLCKEY